MYVWFLNEVPMENLFAQREHVFEWTELKRIKILQKCQGKNISLWNISSPAGLGL